MKQTTSVSLRAAQDRYRRTEKGRAAAQRARDKYNGVTAEQRRAREAHRAALAAERDELRADRPATFRPADRRAGRHRGGAGPRARARSKGLENV